jgi:hypothetical protein
MLRKFSLALVAAAFLLVPTMAKAEFQQGSLELTLGGSGASNRGLTEGSFNVNGSLGYFFTKDLEAGNSVTGSTRVAVDYHFDLGAWRPFVGANIGWDYGSHGVRDTGEIAPEGGIKYFLNPTTFIYGIVEYQVFFRNQHGGNFDHGSFVYGLGLGVLLK